MKSRKALFLASLLLFLLSYTNNYAEKSQSVIIYKEKLDFLSGLNEEELRRLIIKIRDIKKDNLTVNDLRDLHNSNDTIVSGQNFYVINFNFKSNRKPEKLVYRNENESIKNKKLQEIMERSLE